MTDTKTYDLTITTGDAIRFAFMQSHYRSPMDLGAVTPTGYKRVDDARKSLRRLAMACIPSNRPVPQEIVDAVADDLNTPKAIAIMHGYRKSGRGAELFAALRWLGFFGGTFWIDDVELKTFPAEHEFSNVEYIGFDAPHRA